MERLLLFFPSMAVLGSYRGLVVAAADEPAPLPSIGEMWKEMQSMQMQIGDQKAEISELRTRVDNCEAGVVAAIDGLASRQDDIGGVGKGQAEVSAATSDGCPTGQPLYAGIVLSYNSAGRWDHSGPNWRICMVASQLPTTPPLAHPVLPSRNGTTG
eukprot:SAG22_NODE_73_length_22318_cov_47.105315_24_plen_157_part_00